MYTVEIWERGEKVQVSRHRCDLASTAIHRAIRKKWGRNKYFHGSYDQMSPHMWIGQVGKFKGSYVTGQLCIYVD